jgi:hypothetical protein
MAGARHPALERRKYIAVLIHHNAEVDPIDTFQNEARVIEFSENDGSKACTTW